MSIYSGFATRHQQQTYDGLTEDLVYVLQKRLLKFYKNEDADESKFLSILSHIYGHLAKMQENKYLQPKLSKSIEDILKFLSNKELKQLKHVDKNYMPTFKQSSTAPLKFQNKIRTHRDSFSKLNQPTSVGKIIRQINSNNESNASLADSRNTFFNHRHENNHTEDNPESKVLDLSHEKKKPGKESPHVCIQSYLQKNKKNYLRGYRKRQMKSKSYSSKEAK